MKDAITEIRSLRISPDKIHKEREEVRKRVNEEKTIRKKGTSCIWPRDADIKSQEKKRKSGKMTFWYRNVETLTQWKHQEQIKLIKEKENSSDTIALVEAKPKKTYINWNPVWHKFKNCYFESINMNPKNN